LWEGDPLQYTIFIFSQPIRSTRLVNFYPPLDGEMSERFHEQRSATTAVLGECRVGDGAVKVTDGFTVNR